MLVCHCLGVSDRTIREAVREGAETVDDVHEVCGAGSGCGGCRELVSDVITQERVCARRSDVVPTDRLCGRRSPESQAGVSAA
ncbi:MAG TPA: (2Fe-2S)-binding protein [Polyangiaceae bacterium]|jgi:bacterioferritin-associated ferredoxin|nr:(2Fe-2S)-binding protein [Polyangiaceae bacterium]